MSYVPRTVGLATTKGKPRHFPDNIWGGINYAFCLFFTDTKVLSDLLSVRRGSRQLTLVFQKISTGLSSGRFSITQLLI